MKRNLKLLAIPGATAIAIVVAAMAWAIWSASGSGSATGTLGTLNQPTNVSGDQRGTDPIVDVSWTGVAAPDANAIDGYHVERRLGLAGSWVDACATSTTPRVLDTDGPGCVDNGMAAGTHYYRVTALFRSWTARSTDSTGVAVVLDTTPPTVPAPGVTAAITFGTNPIFVTNEAVTLTSAATDAGTGVESVQYYVCAGATGSCTSGALIGGSSTGPNYQVSWNTPLPADGPYRIVAVGKDNTDNSATSPATVISVDTTPPTASTPTVNG